MRLTWYVTDKSEYRAALKELGAAYREIVGEHYPAMALVQVADLLEEGAKVEIEATAVLPLSTVAQGRFVSRYVIGISRIVALSLPFRREARLRTRSRAAL